MYELNTVDDVPELNVEAQDPVLETGEGTTNAEVDAQPQEQQQEIAEPAPRQTPEENHANKLARQEADRRISQAESTAAQAKLEVERVARILGQHYGFNGSLAEIADTLEAQYRQVDRNTVRREREVLEAESRIQLQLKKIEDEGVTRYAERQIQEDLTEIRKLDPNIQSLDALGQDFTNLRFARNGSGELMYTAAQAYGEWHKRKVPAKQNPGTQHMAPVTGNAPSAVLHEIPSDQLDFYKDNFPADTVAQLKVRYNRIIQRQGD